MEFVAVIVSHGREQDVDQPGGLRPSTSIFSDPFIMSKDSFEPVLEHVMLATLLLK